MESTHYYLDKYDLRRRLAVRFYYPMFNVERIYFFGFDTRNHYSLA